MATISPIAFAAVFATLEVANRVLWSWPLAQEEAADRDGRRLP